MVAGHRVAESGVAASAPASLGFVTTAQMPQVGTKFGRWLDLTFMQLQLDDRTRTGCHRMNQSLTLAFLIAAGIGLVVQNTLDGTHHPDVLYHSHRHVAELTGGDCAVCHLFYGLSKVWRGLANWCPACAGGR